MRNSHTASIKEHFMDTVFSETDRELLSLIGADLRDGPIYLDPNQNPCSPFDEGAVPFDLSNAFNTIKEKIENNTPVYIEPWCGFVESAPPNEEGSTYFEYDTMDVIRILGLSSLV